MESQRNSEEKKNRHEINDASYGPIISHEAMQK